MIIRICLLVGSLLLHTAAMAPWGYTAAAWICLVPLLVALEGLSPGRALAVGLAWGTAQIWLVCFWTAPALAFYWQQPWWFGVAFLLIASAIFVGIYYGLFALTLSRLRRRFSGIALALLTASLWVSGELAQSRLLGGDPWMLLGYALVPRPQLIQLAEIGGVFLLSFVVALVNALLAVAWRSSRPWRPLVLAVAAVVGVAVYGEMRLAATWPQENTSRVAVIQGNNDPGSQWDSREHGRGLETYLRLTRAALASKPAVIVWPESSVTFFMALEKGFQEQIARLAAASEVEIILGGPHADTTEAERPHYFNSAFRIDREGQLAGRYDKTHLLPFAEYFPLQTISLLRRQFERVRSFTPGGPPQLLPSPLGPVAVAICFEGIFPSLVRSYMAEGAGWLINLSNDAWLSAGTKSEGAAIEDPERERFATAGPEQHLTMVALRSVEHRTWVVRATTTGVSAIIDPWGRIVERSRSFREAIVEHEVGAIRVTTPYERFGDSFAWMCLAVSAGALGLGSRARPHRL